MRANNLLVSPVKPAPPGSFGTAKFSAHVVSRFLSRNCYLIETSSVVGKSDPIRKEIITMKPKHLFIHILAVLFAIPLAGTVAQGATIEVIETFDYPGLCSPVRRRLTTTAPLPVFLSTRPGPRKASSAVAGVILATRSSSLTLTHFTEVRGINNKRKICGDYTTSDGVTHGFFRSHANFFEYDISSAFTVVLGINNAGDFSGSFIDDADGIQKALLALGNGHRFQRARRSSHPDLSNK